MAGAMATRVRVRDVLPQARHTKLEERPCSRFARLHDTDPAIDPARWQSRRDELFRRERERVAQATGKDVEA